MLLLEIRHLAKAFDERTLFSIDHLEVFSGQRIGLIGANGSGKTTLLRIIQGQMEPDRGSVRRLGSIAVVEQLDYRGTPAIEEHGLAGRWRVPHRLERSGGEDTRAQLAAASAANAHLWLLDEPTSHLDLDGRKQLAETLVRHPGAAVIISHDRSFLDATCTNVWDLDRGSISVYEGNFSAYSEMKQQAALAHESAYENYIAEKRRLQRAVQDRASHSQGMRSTPKRMGNSEARLHKRAVGGKQSKVDRSAKALETRLEKLEVVEKPWEEAPIQFDLRTEALSGGQWILRADEAVGQMGKHLVYDRLKFHLPRRAKLAVVGPNGSGKTTFLRSLERVDQRTLYWSPGTRIGFFRQDLDTLDPEDTLLEAVAKDSTYPESFIRTVLARLLFRREQTEDPVAVLSGGERVKAILAQITLGQNDVLVLDEPTNYLDMHSIEGLTGVLRAFPGTVIFASHDQSFLEEIADHILDFSHRPPRFFAGSWKEYQRPPIEPDSTDELVLRTRAAHLAAALDAETDPAKKRTLDQEWETVQEQLRQLLLS